MPYPDEIHTTPDDAPGTTVRVVNRTPQHTNVQRLQATVREHYGAGRRAVFSGVLLSDGRLISDGGMGQQGQNQFTATQDRGPCPSWAAAEYDAPIPILPDEPETPPPYTGPQDATITGQRGGDPFVVKVYGADGYMYHIAPDSDPTSMDELSGIAPQGATLVITGTWDRDTLLVSVTDWYIGELGPGHRTYGIDPDTGEMKDPDEIGDSGIPDSDTPPPDRSGPTGGGGEQWGREKTGGGVAPVAADSVGAPLNAGMVAGIGGLLFLGVLLSGRRDEPQPLEVR
jgi:hypothetical protein